MCNKPRNLDPFRPKISLASLKVRFNSYIRKAIVLSAAAAVAGFGKEPLLRKGVAAMNAASLTPAGLPQYGVAPGSCSVVLGRDLRTGDPVEQQNPGGNHIFPRSPSSLIHYQQPA